MCNKNIGHRLGSGPAGMPVRGASRPCATVPRRHLGAVKIPPSTSRCREAFRPGPSRSPRQRAFSRTVALQLASVWFLAPGLAGVAGADFPEPYNSEAPGLDPPPAPESMAMIELPEGFSVSLFAAEPGVMNPIGMTWDERGRLWVAENFTYAERELRFDLDLRDRVIILEDSTGDGRADRRTVVLDDAQKLTSVELGRGGLWLMASPNLLFVPLAEDGQTVAGPPEVVLDGFTVARNNYHNFANGLRWGPDGWLYGRVGHSCPAEVGAPGTPPHERVPVRGGIWRFDPDSGTVEALTSGTTNSWGHDWDRHGQGFLINTVHGHLWHLIPGAHFEGAGSPSPHPRVYRRLAVHADHWHFDTRGEWHESRDGAADAHGGGHAHVGMMIYQGGQWPEALHDRLMTLNFHGRRVNVERLERHGSGYIGRHEPDMFQTADEWFRGIELAAGPCGSVWVLDWSDIGECHEHTGVHRTSGRIYRLSHGEVRSPEQELRELAGGGFTQEVAERVVRHGNVWFERQWRRLLADQPHRLTTETASRLAALAFDDGGESTVRLRSLWALHQGGRLEPDALARLLGDDDEHVRVWAVRLLTDDWPLDALGRVRMTMFAAEDQAALAPKLVRLAGAEPSGLVRLTLASTLQRMPPEWRAPLAAALMSHGDDAADANLPDLVWYGLLPLWSDRPMDLAGLAAAPVWPDTLRWIVRSLAEGGEATAPALAKVLAAAPGHGGEHHGDDGGNDDEAPGGGNGDHAAGDDPATSHDPDQEGATDAGARFEADPTAQAGWIAAVTRGLADASEGRRQLPAPEGWDRFLARALVLADEDTMGLLHELGAVYGDGRALEQIRRLALDSDAEPAMRRSALATLVETGADDARQISLQLLGTRGLAAAAAAGLASFADADLGREVARRYPGFHAEDRPGAMDALVSRPEFAAALLEAIDAGRIDADELAAHQVRQLRSLGDGIDQRRVVALWGDLITMSDQRREQVEHWRQALGGDVLADADLGRGRVLFQSLCASCHVMYGEGGNLGPDLTGSGRADLDYLLDRIVDPNAVVGEDYRLTTVTLDDGRVIGGVVAGEGGGIVTLRTVTGDMRIERERIVEMETGGASIMPEGLIDALPEDMVRDLIGYLMHPVQVPLPPAADGGGG